MLKVLQIIVSVCVAILPIQFSVQSGLLFYCVWFLIVFLLVLRARGCLEEGSKNIESRGNKVVFPKSDVFVRRFKFLAG